MARLPDFMQATPQTLIRDLQELSRYLRSLTAGTGKDGINGEDGNDGKDGQDGIGGSCSDWADVTISSSPQALDADDVNKTVYVTNGGGGAKTLTLPTSAPGDWIVVVNASQSAGPSYTVAVDCLLGVSPALISGAGVYCRSDGMGRWVYVTLTGTTPTTRVY